MDDIYKEFGRLLKARRTGARLTQDALATKVGLVRTSITNIEQGRQQISLQTLYQLADAVGATPQDLLPSKPVNPISESLERNLLTTPLDEEGKNWVRRIVSRAPTKGENCDVTS